MEQEFKYKSEKPQSISGLIGIIEQQEFLINQQIHKIRELELAVGYLRDEIARLKNIPPRPKVQASQLEKNKANNCLKKRAGSEKRSKTAFLKIHDHKTIQAPRVPDGAKFKGYKNFTVQDLVIQAHNTRYHLERWQTEDGSYIEAELPNSIHGHFGNQLKTYIIYQYYQCHVTQPRLLEELREFGIDISAGEINFILTEGHENFHEEKADILKTGLQVSPYIQVDDTGARHAGKNGFCTVIGNSWFTWFQSTESKSRINFLQLLQMQRFEYKLNSTAEKYIKEHKLDPKALAVVLDNMGQTILGKANWEKTLAQLGISGIESQRIITEAALVGALIENGFRQDLLILSDDAFQYNAFPNQQALCWIHAERNIHRLVPVSNTEAIELDSVRTEIWVYYHLLKRFQ